MGINGNFIIRHKFRQTKDKKASSDFFSETINRLYEYFDLWNGKFDDCDYVPIWVARLNYGMYDYDMAFYLYSDFWLIEHGWRYYPIMYHEDSVFRFRGLAFDLARVLGENEAWYVSDEYTLDCNMWDDENFTLAQWLEHSEKKLGKPIPEFEQPKFLSKDFDELRSVCEPVYHDNFKECNELLDALQPKLGGYNLMTVFDDKYGCEKDGELFRVDKQTLEANLNISGEWCRLAEKIIRKYCAEVSDDTFY